MSVIVWRWASVRFFASATRPSSLVSSVNRASIIDSHRWRSVVRSRDLTVVEVVAAPADAAVRGTATPAAITPAATKRFHIGELLGSVTFHPDQRRPRARAYTGLHALP